MPYNSISSVMHLATVSDAINVQLEDHFTLRDVLEDMKGALR